MKNKLKPPKLKPPNRQNARKRLSKHLEQVNLYAAGIDIGSEEHYVAVADDLDDQAVRSFSTFTVDLNRLADWLVQIGINTVAMESTGIYWIPLFEILEERGLKVLLVNARYVKNVSGRKTDVLDCQWIQQLHTYGLLEGAFRPPEQVCALRAYFRQRDNLIRYAGSHIQHIQKALRQMNILLDNVVSDVTGVTGMTIIRAICEGDTDAETLAKYRDHRCHKSEAEIANSLRGHYREEHLFSLRQSVELYDVYQQKILACDKEIEQQLSRFDDKADPSNLDATAIVNKRGNALSFDVRSSLYRITGVDVTRIDGISEVVALKVVSETGTSMEPWKTVKHFASWLALAPRNKVSGGKILSSKTPTSANRAASAFRMAAFAVSRSNTALGAYYRRMRSRLGAPKAITATAHKIARIFYHMLKNGTEYVDQGQDYYEQQYRDRVLANLKKKATQLGFELVNLTVTDKTVVVT